MGALRATVSIRGREIDILFSHIEFSRKTDKKGRPVTSVIGGKLTFSIEATKDTEILESMVNSQFKPVSGKIIFYRTDDNSGRTRQTLWRAVQMLTQKLCCQTIHDCPKVVPLHYESEWQ